MQAMNTLVVLILLALVLSINAKINITNIPEISYFFSSFDTDEKAGLRLSYSTDGYIFEALNDNKPVLTPKIGDKILRDPCILYGPDNIFHLVYTTSWNSKEIGYANSKDLVNWSEEILLPVMHNEPETQHCWAPEIIYDSNKKHYLIFWASSIKGKLEGRYHIFSTTTTDFKTLTPTKLFYSVEGENDIDPSLFHDIDHNQWLLFVKSDTKGRVDGRIDMVKSESPEGPWGSVTKSIAPMYNFTEGPTAMKIGKYYHMYFDIPDSFHMGLVRSSDLIHWEDMTSHIKFPPKAKHGTIFKVTPDLVRMVSKAGL